MLRTRQARTRDIDPLPTPLTPKNAPRCPAFLIVIDQRPILKAALTACKRTQTKVRKCYDELQRYEAEDIPGYEAWKARTLGKELSRLRTLEAELQRKAAIIRSIHWATEALGVPVYDVYDYVMKHMADPDYRHPEYDKHMDEGAGDEDGDPHDKAFHDDDDDFEDDDDYFDDEEEEERFWESFRNYFTGQGESSQQPENSSPHESRELKQIYRRLAKRLHPDSTSELTPMEKERWNAANEAYRRGDLDALRQIETLCESWDIIPSIELGLARLEDIRHYHEKHFRELSEKRRACKRSEAWGFSKTTESKRKNLCIRLKQSYAYDIEYLQEELNQIDEILKEAQEAANDRPQTPEKPAPKGSQNFDYRDDIPQPRKKQATKPRPKPADPCQAEFTF